MAKPDKSSRNAGIPFDRAEIDTVALRAVEGGKVEKLAGITFYPE